MTIEHHDNTNPIAVIESPQSSIKRKRNAKVELLSAVEILIYQTINLFWHADQIMIL